MGGKARTFWWALVSCALMAIGALGPWVTVLGFSASGTEGDGWIVLLTAFLAAGLVLWHDRSPRMWKLGAAGLAAVAAFGTGAYDWSEIESVAAEAEELEGAFDLSVSVGWGLILCTIASVSLAAAIVAHWVRHRAASFTPASAEVPAEAAIEAPAVEEPPAQPDA